MNLFFTKSGVVVVVKNQIGFTVELSTTTLSAADNLAAQKKHKAVALQLCIWVGILKDSRIIVDERLAAACLVFLKLAGVYWHAYCLKKGQSVAFRYMVSSSGLE